MSIRLLQLTDCHLFVSPQATIQGICTRERWLSVLAAIEPEQTRAHRLILTGDMTHDDLPETYRVIRETLAPWWLKARFLPGNHDVREGIHEYLHDRIQRVGERVVFSEPVDGWQLIGLDSHLPGQVKGELGGEQLDWLADELTRTSNRPTVLFLHHPPVDAPSPWMNAIGLTDRDALWSLLRSHAQVRLICAGHVHHESTTQRQGVTVVTTPATGVQFTPESETLVVDDLPWGYRLVELQDDGTFQTRVVRLPLRTVCETRTPV
jgi:Icc protein